MKDLLKHLFTYEELEYLGDMECQFYRCTLSEDFPRDWPKKWDCIHFDFFEGEMNFMNGAGTILETLTLQIGVI